jgi:tetratricopeptide (TPR) repeat protein
LSRCSTTSRRSQGRPETRAGPATSRALALRKEAAEREQATPEELNDCAWSLLTCEPADLRDAKTALGYAERAARLTGEKDPAILDTLALARFHAGQVREAIETQEKAIGLLPPAGPDDPAREMRAELEARLREFEAALTGPGRPGT